MATKNLVPRQDAEGKLGLSTRRWLEINAVSGSFPTVITDSLKNSANQNLIQAGTGISISYDNEAITITSSASQDSEVDRIFEGPEGSQTSVETINTTDPVENKITFSISGSEKWFINSDGHMLPSLTGSYDLGGSNNTVRRIWVNNDGLTFKTSGFLSSRINVTSKQRLQFGALSSTEGTTYDYVSISKESVRVATTSPLTLNLIQDQNDTNSLRYTESDLTTLKTSIEIDGITLDNNDKVLIKDHPQEQNNGIYTVSGVGTGITLDRIGSLNNADDFANLNVTVLEGTENGQQIFFTVPYVDPQTSLSGTTVGVHDMKWLRVTGGGLEAVQDDSAPVLGGNLNLDTYRIFSGNNIRLATNSDDNDNGGIEIFDTSASMHALQINSSKHANTESSLRFVANDSYNLDIVGKTISGSGSDYPLTGDVKFYFVPLASEYEGASSHSDAIIATRNWVNDQGFLSSSVTYATQAWVNEQGFLTSHQDLIGYVQSDSEASLTSLTLSETTPTADGHAASKAYVDGIAQGLSIIASVRVMQESLISGSYNNTNGTITLTGTPTTLQVDGIELSDGDRILYNQNLAPSHNGVYVVSGIGSGVVLTRSSDFNTGDSVASKFVFIEEGTDYGDKGFACTSASGSDVVGTNNITFTQISAAGQISAGSALQKDGSTLNVLYDETTIGLNDSSPAALEVKNVPVDKLVLGGPNNDLKIASSLLPDITATSVDENNFVIDDITTELSALATDDKFVVWDASVGDPDSPVAKITAGNINQFIRAGLSNISGDISLTYTTGTGALASAIKKEAITTKTELTTLANDDQLLITDSVNEVLKRVKYSTIKSSIEAALDTGLDIHGLPKIPDSNIGNLDELALYNMPADGDVTTVLASVRVATTSNLSTPITLNSGMEVDGVILAENDRVLVKSQTGSGANLTHNGVYTVTASGSSPRSDDLAVGTLFHESYVKVLEGTQNAGKDFILTGADPDPETREIGSLGIVYVNEYITQNNVNHRINLTQLTNHIKKSLSQPVLLTEPATISSPVRNTHYILQYNSVTGGGMYQFIFDFSSGTYEENDEVKISSSILGSSPIYSVVIRTNSNGDNDVVYTPEELQKTITLIYKSNSWKLSQKDHRTIQLKNSTQGKVEDRTRDTSRDFLVSTDSASSRSQWLSNPVVNLRDVNPVVVLPISSTLGNLSTGFTKTYYVSHNESEFITFESDIIIKKDNNSSGFTFEAGKKKIDISTEEGNISKFTVTLLENESGEKGLFIESSQISSASSGSSLPEGDAYTVLNYTSGETPTLQATKLSGSNIKLNTISGGEFAVPLGGTTEVTSGNIRKHTIVGGANGNIALNTVSPENIKKINDYKVYGQLSGESIPEEDAQNITEVEVIHSGYEIPVDQRPEGYQTTLGLNNEIKKDDSLATTKAIKEFVIEKTSTLSSPTTIEQTVVNVTGEYIDQYQANERYHVQEFKFGERNYLSDTYFLEPDGSYLPSSNGGIVRSTLFMPILTDKYEASTEDFFEKYFINNHRYNSVNAYYDTKTKLILPPTNSTLINMLLARQNDGKKTQLHVQMGFDLEDSTAITSYEDWNTNFASGPQLTTNSYVKSGIFNVEVFDTDITAKEYWRFYGNSNPDNYVIDPENPSELRFDNSDQLIEDSISDSYAISGVYPTKITNTVLNNNAKSYFFDVLGRELLPEQIFGFTSEDITVENQYKYPYITGKNQGTRATESISNQIEHTSDEETITKDFIIQYAGSTKFHIRSSSYAGYGGRYWQTWGAGYRNHLPQVVRRSSLSSSLQNTTVVSYIIIEPEVIQSEGKNILIYKITTKPFGGTNNGLYSKNADNADSKFSSPKDQSTSTFNNVPRQN